VSGDFLFDGKYDGLFLDNGMFDLNNPIVRPGCPAGRKDWKTDADKILHIRDITTL
jgi:hypothetical protein